jgi:hypothetical protein
VALGDQVAAGIYDSIGAAVAAAEALAQAVADVLPSSDAKEGPLDHITAQGRALPEVFARGILANIGAAVGAASRMAGQVAGMLAPGTGMQLAGAVAGGGIATVGRGQGTGGREQAAPINLYLNIAKVGDEVDVESMAYRVAEVLQWRGR